MKKRNIVIFVLLLAVLFIRFNFGLKNSFNSLEITKIDEKTISEYLNTKTDDILAATDGRVYSSFTILGTDKDRIYLWLLKEEYIKKDNDITLQSGVSLPVVLYIKNDSNKIEIISHKIPADGAEHEETMRKLFPRNIRNKINHNNNERAKSLELDIKNRVEEDFKN